MEEVGNQHGETKGEEQARKADEALELHHNGVSPFMGAQRQHTVIRDTPIATDVTDAVLGWDSGSISAFPGGPPFTADLARVAGVSAQEGSTVNPVPGLRDSGAGGRLTSSPFCGQGNWNADKIFGS
jgi:hypothetical protein